MTGRGGVPTGSNFPRRDLYVFAIALNCVFLTACAGPQSTGSSFVDAKLLAFNDFHGHIGLNGALYSGGKDLRGSAPVLASYLEKARAGMEDRTIIVSAGDFVGASPPDSSLLRDEPSIMFLNTLANSFCADRMDRRCNVVATVGNHEFDRGVAELKRLINGGTHATGPYLENPYLGAHFPYVAANVIDNSTGKTLLPPYVIKDIRGIPVAFIGAVVKDTPAVASHLSGVTFIDEADAINGCIPEIRAKGVKAVVAIIHQGGVQPPYEGKTDRAMPPLSGYIVPIVSRLDGDVAIVISGHTHAFTNAIIRNAAGKDVLVTQAVSNGTAFAEIMVRLDPVSREIVSTSAEITPVLVNNPDGSPRVLPDARVEAIVSAADKTIEPKIRAIAGHAERGISREQNHAGESALGNLLADALRSYGKTDFAFMNPGGIRADIVAGSVNWGNLFSVQPFGDRVVRMTMTGRQIRDLLGQQWADPVNPKFLQISGLTYAWSLDTVANRGIVGEVLKDGIPLVETGIYTVTVNNFLSNGGDLFTVFRNGSEKVPGAVDIDVVFNYLGEMPQPFNAAIEGRIKRLD